MCVLNYYLYRLFCDYLDYKIVYFIINKYRLSKSPSCPYFAVFIIILVRYQIPTRSVEYYPRYLISFFGKIIDDPRVSDRDDVFEDKNAYYNDVNIVENVYAYNYTVVKIFADFRDKIKAAYSEDIK